MRALPFLLLIACGASDARIAPTIVSATLSPASPVTGDVLSLQVDVDAAAPPALAARWTIDRHVVQDGADLTLETAIVRGQQVEVEVRATDAGGTATLALDPVFVGNALPTARRARITPDPAKALSTPLCVVDEPFDAEGDRISWTFAWTIGADDAGTDAELDAMIARGDALGCTATGHDPFGAGAPLVAEEVVVVDTPPVWSAPRVLPDPPTRDQPLHVTLDRLTDADHDRLSALIQWRVGGVDAGYAEHLDPSRFRRGDVVEALVTAQDGFLYGDTVTTPAVTIADAPPRVAVTLAPPFAAPGDHLVADVVATDADDDTLDVVVTWEADGDVVGTGSELVVPDLPAGTQLVARAVADDQLVTTTATSSATVVVATPEETRVVRITPPHPGPHDALRCTAFGEGAPALSWTADGVAVDPDLLETTSLDGDTVPGSLTTAGATWACTATWRGTVADDDVTIAAGPIGGNVLVVVVDDLGVDKVGAYRMHPDPPPTPTIDALAAEGALFRNAFANPSCSPTRATLLTGRYARHTGIGRPLVDHDAFILSPTEVGLPEALAFAPTPYASAAIGKWHLSSSARADGLTHPADLGFDTWSIVLGNLGPSLLSTSHTDYSSWEVDVDGVVEGHGDVYLTTAQVDAAIEAVTTLPEPWFVYLAFSAPHRPSHVPPEDLQTSGIDDSATDGEKYDAMVEALDHELGRLLAAMSPAQRADTTIVVLGDNGTPDYATTAPFVPAHAKTSVFEAGTHVPLIVVGPAVAQPGVEIEGLVEIVDLFPTLSAIAGAPVDALFTTDAGPGTLATWGLDGRSLLPMLADPSAPGRDVVFLEKFAENGGSTPHQFDEVAVRDDRWRYVVDLSGFEGLYDLATLDYVDDGPNLLRSDTPSDEALAAQTRLRGTLTTILTRLESTP